MVAVAGQSVELQCSLAKELQALGGGGGGERNGETSDHSIIWLKGMQRANTRVACQIARAERLISTPPPNYLTGRPTD